MSLSKELVAVACSIEAPLTQNTFNISIDNKEYPALCDSGASISCISRKTYNEFRQQYALVPGEINVVCGVSGTLLDIQGKVTLPMVLGNVELIHTFYVLSRMSTSTLIIIGLDFFQAHRALSDWANHVLKIQDGMTEIAFNEPIDKQCLLRTVSKVNIPPRTVSIIPVKAKCKYSNYTAISLIEPVVSWVVKNLMGARCLVPVNRGFTICQIMNPTQSPISVEVGSTIAKISSMTSTGTLCSIDPPSKSSASTNSINLKHAKGKSQSELIDVAKELGVNLNNSNLNENQKKDFLAFIGANRYVFAKSIKELGLCNKYEFEIDTGDSVPVKKRFYMTSPEAEKEINRQVEEMLDNDIIEPCMSPWSSPVVLVPKKTGEY